jgi:hypothetical protein
MRLWTIHPRFLDAKGLTAVWREGLLARKVLQGRTRGYRHHPQLERFRAHPRPVQAVESYLCGILAESDRRGYAFDAGKIRAKTSVPRIPVTTGQVSYEWKWLKLKLRMRSPDWYRAETLKKSPLVHPLFRIHPGPVEGWERAAFR